MSRFSQAEAEAAGWSIVHQRDEYEVTVGPGLTKKHPQTIVAEKYLSLPGQAGRLIHEEAETMGKLLERIHSFELHLGSVDALGEKSEPAIVDESSELPSFSLLGGADQPKGLGDPVQAVVIPVDPGDLTYEAEVTTLTDAEWSSRSRADTLVIAGEDGEQEQVIYSGGSEAVVDAEQLRSEHKKAVEDRRAAEPAHGPVEQIEVDTSNLIDSPGVGAGGTLIVREGEEAEDVAERKDDLKKMRDEGRVASSQLQGQAIAPEGADQLAGSDVGIQERGDLGSETPQQGAVAGTLEEPQSDLEKNPASHLYPEGKPAESEPIPESDEDEDEEAIASVEADADGFTEKDDIEATDAAKALASELGVDLSQVEGSGKEGRITAPDVEAAVEAATQPEDK